MVASEIGSLPLTGTELDFWLPGSALPSPSHHECVENDSADGSSSSLLVCLSNKINTETRERERRKKVDKNSLYMLKAEVELALEK